MALFKNLIVYRIGADYLFPELTFLEEVASRFKFQPCEPTQQLSTGFISPRGDDFGPLIEAIDGQVIMKLKVERKSVPSAAVKAALEEACKKIENETGRKPGRKEKNELKEEIVLTLLPRAFSKFSTNTVWIDRQGGTLVVGAGSARGADGVVAALVDLLAEAKAPIMIAPLNTNVSPSTAMANWLLAKEAPGSFHLEREVELKSSDEERATVRYARHNLELDEITQHIAQGKAPSRLAVSWEGRVGFTLCEDGSLKKFESILESPDADPSADAFDADVALTTGELRAMLPDLWKELGGEVTPGEAGSEGEDVADETDVAIS